jgi:nucleoside 2-deoxyribosyltransferase
MQQRWLIEEARDNLKSRGIDVFSPIHDVGKGIADDVVPADIEGIEQSDVLFAIVDGLDSGTIFEIGYARALGKGVVVYVENETEENLKMLSGTGCEIESDFVTAIYKSKWLAMES